MWKSGDLHCKCQQHLTLLFLMHKLLASIIKKMETFSLHRAYCSHLTGPTFCLPYKQTYWAAHALSNGREKRLFFKYSTPAIFLSNQESLHALTATKTNLDSMSQGQGTVFFCGALQALVGAHLHVWSPSLLTSSHHLYRTLGMNFSFWEPTD